MTIDLHVLLNSGSDIEVIRSVVGRMVGSLLEPAKNGNGAVVANALCIDWVLYGNHNVEDDNGIEFTKFAHVLKLDPLNAGPNLATYDVMYEKAALFMAYILSHQLGCRTLVVRGLVRKVAAYDNGREEAI